MRRQSMFGHGLPSILAFTKLTLFVNLLLAHHWLSFTDRILPG